MPTPRAWFSQTHASHGSRIALVYALVMSHLLVPINEHHRRGSNLLLHLLLCICCSMSALVHPTSPSLPKIASKDLQSVLKGAGVKDETSGANTSLVPATIPKLQVMPGPPNLFSQDDSHSCLSVSVSEMRLRWHIRPRSQWWSKTTPRLLPWSSK